MFTFFKNVLIQYLIHQVSHFAKYSLNIKYLTFGCYFSWEQFFRTPSKIKIFWIKCKLYLEARDSFVDILKLADVLPHYFHHDRLNTLQTFFSKSTPSETFLLPFLLSLFEVFSPGYGNLTTRTALGKVSPLKDFFLKDFSKKRMDILEVWLF